MKTLRQSFFWLRDTRQHPLLFLLSVWTMMMALSWSVIALSD